MKWLLIAIAVSFLPIWRSGVHSRKEGVDFYQYMRDLNQKGYEPFGHPHIPYEEAVLKAEEAYCGCLRIGRRQE